MLEAPLRKALRRPYEGFSKASERRSLRRRCEVLAKEMRRSLRRGCEGPCEEVAKVLAKASERQLFYEGFRAQLFYEGDARYLRRPYFKKAPFT